MDVAVSVNGVPIRLTDERWRHIVENRDELAGHLYDVLDAVENAQLVLPGYGGALIAVRGFGRDRYLLVVYKEVSRRDGFVITAFPSRRIDRRAIVWRRES